MAAIRVVGSIRDWFNTRDVRRMVRRQVFPETLVRHYFDQTEHGRDEAALQGVGYMMVGKQVTPTHVGVTIPASTNGLHRSSRPQGPATRCLDPHPLQAQARAGVDAERT